MRKEKWVNDVRAIACIMVALGHLLVGLAEILPDAGYFWSWLIGSLYLVHVQLFFFCSGYLRQKKNNTSKEYPGMVVNKLLNLGIPYMVFVSATYLLKVVFSNYVNSEIHDSYWHAVFVLPPNQMWFLFVLIVCFLITPFCMKNTIQMLGMLTAGILGLVLYHYLGDTQSVYLKIFNFYIWFVLGMAYGFLKDRMPVIQKNIWILFVFIFETIIYIFYWQNIVMGTIATVFGIFSVVSICQNQLKDHSVRLLSVIAKYMLQIYLLHTYFAAGIRTVLLRVGCTNAWIHFILAMIGSLAGPVMVGYICEKTVLMNIIFAPVKTIEIINKKRDIRKSDIDNCAGI